ncbi:MAG: TlpA disulfide reductase family protein [Saprospiraceae bacterium]|nr:TlpA disulfide reductase family protein [Saprospiraceae bacterium]
MMPFAPYRSSLLFIALVYFCAISDLSAQTTKLTVYDSLSQLEARISQSPDAVLVVNFWATWCKPCVEELPSFEKLQEQYAGQNVQVLLVSLDFKTKIESKLLPFLKERRLKSEVILFSDQDVNNWIPRIYEDWDGAIPATFVFKGKKRGFKLGQFSDYAEVENFVRAFVLDTSNLASPTPIDYGTGK